MTKLNLISLLLALLCTMVEAGVPVLKFVGNSSLYCPDAIGNVVAQSTDGSVNSEAINNAIIPSGSSTYKGYIVGSTYSTGVAPADVRHLRDGDKRELLCDVWCILNSCPSSTSASYCRTIGCVNCRRRLLATSTAATPMTTTTIPANACDILVAKAKVNLAQQAASTLSSGGPNAVTCAALFNTTIVTCNQS